MSHQAATQSVLHIEVKLKKVDEAHYVRPDLVVDTVREWLLSDFHVLQLNQQITTFGALEHASVIEAIKVADHSGPAVGSDLHNIYETGSVRLDVQAYELLDTIPEMLERGDPQSDNQEEEAPEARVTLLPNKALDGLWSSLYFEDDIPARLLRYLTKMMTLSRNPKLNLDLLNWNKLILLYGPPGSGKTSLIMALAQKLSIRLGSRFSEGRLIEISSQSMHSRWFGQSGKLVSKMFDAIIAIAEQDDQCLVCVMIDEIESLTASREKATQGNECNDALRATNQILTGLDRLRSRSNVLVFATSNLLDAIDPAFLDRADIKQLVPTPGPGAIYEILRTTLNELIRCDAITSPGAEMEGVIMEEASGQVGEWTLVQNKLLPQLKELELFPEGRQLWSITRKCQGMSGRTLRRLPFSAIALHTYTETCSLSESLAALEIAVTELQQTMPYRGFGI